LTRWREFAAWHNPGLTIEGLLLTMYDERTNLSSAVASDLRDFYGQQVFETVIPRNVRLAEAPVMVSHNPL
jgi:chromosome partitioning protein